jgi:hypothetical protein
MLAVLPALGVAVEVRPAVPVEGVLPARPALGAAVPAVAGALVPALGVLVGRVSLEGGVSGAPHAARIEAINIRERDARYRAMFGRLTR